MFRNYFSFASRYCNNSLKSIKNIRFNISKSSLHSTSTWSPLNKIGIFPIVIPALVFGATAFVWDYYNLRKARSFRYYDLDDEKPKFFSKNVSDETIINWAGTSSCNPSYYFEPETEKEIIEILKYFDNNKMKIRPIGNALSPSGLALSDDGLINLCNYNKILDVDVKNKTITVQAGCTLTQIMEALSQHNLSVQNIPSIQSQQIGGILSVGAHGTGYKIPPCDMQIIEYTIILPDGRKYRLNKDTNQTLFNLCKVSLGYLGVLSEIKIQAIDRHRLIEKVRVFNTDELLDFRRKNFSNLKHFKTLWMPYTNYSATITCEEYNENEEHTVQNILSNIPKSDPLTSMKNLYKKWYPNSNINIDNVTSFADVRDYLLTDGKYALNTNYIKELNKTELQYWRNVSIQNDPSNITIDWNDKLLSFDCGGQQLVYEISFNCGELSNIVPNSKYDIPIDVKFMKELLQNIEKNNIPSPIPLEQRFTANSNSLMSPAHSYNNNDIFNWVGIIIYISLQNEETKNELRKVFVKYEKILNELCRKYNAVGHWAKIDTWGYDDAEVEKIRNLLRTRYNDNLNTFLKYRKQFDPNNTLINPKFVDMFGDEHL